MSANEIIRHTPEPIEREPETEAVEETEVKQTPTPEGTTLIVWGHYWRFANNVATSPYVNVVV
jgi:hypothetical protein